jgi:hypothetical protein
LSYFYSSAKKCHLSTLCAQWCIIYMECLGRYPKIRWKELH